MENKLWKVVFALIILWKNSVVFSYDCNCSSPVNEMLQVHVVPHSHDDVGWQITVDQYYYYGVQYILDSVVMELKRDPNKKFIYVEMAFFERWWNEQNDEMQKMVKVLVKEKRLEFINGGWSMNDEATTHYNAIIDQMTYGLRFILDTFGEEARPTVAWHIDPFGHSAEQASIFSQMSFDGFFLGRNDWADRAQRLKDKTMELMWRGSRNLEQESQIFTGVLHRWYFPPPYFCFDQGCNDPPIQDDPKLFDENVKQRVNDFVKATCDQAKHYTTNNIILTMGGDFNYQNAHHWFKNLDKLIRYVNEDGRVNAFYSTPSIYLKALHDAGKTWGVKTDDFFPYSHVPHAFWTGYFTSRPTLKRYIRESNSILQVCKQVEAVRDKSAVKESSDVLRRAMGVNQHHDAVTGTEKQHVANDYAKRLYMGREECQSAMNLFLKATYPKKVFHTTNVLTSGLDFKRCDYLNISLCEISETGQSIVINFYNPSAKSRKTFARIPIASKSVEVLGPDGKSVFIQINPLSHFAIKLRKYFKGHATYEAVFEVLMPPLGYATYFLKHTSEIKKRNPNVVISKVKAMKAPTNYIENTYQKLIFSPESGRLIQIENKRDGTKVDVSQNFFYYQGSDGDRRSKQTSGAYVFRPRSQIPKPIDKDGNVKASILTGPLVSEVRQTFSPYVKQIIRLYKDKQFAEFEHIVGPIPVKDKIGKEVITRFDTTISNDGIYYTDANGREMKKRTRDYRETWKMDTKLEPVSQNYYPINSRIYINDSNSQLTVLTDRSQGGGSIKDGQLEIMLHRRLLKDDFLGVGEPLNEIGPDGNGLVTIGRHLVFLTKPRKAATLHRLQGELMLVDPYISFSRNPFTTEEWMKMFNTVHSELAFELPQNIHLLSLETTNTENEIILRLEHFFEKDEDEKLSKPTKVSLAGMFPSFTILSVTEMNLAANQRLSEKKMWHWKTNGDSRINNISQKEILEMRNKPYNNNYTQWKFRQYDTMEIILNPMQIRTYILRVRDIYFTRGV